MGHLWGVFLGRSGPATAPSGTSPAPCAYPRDAYPVGAYPALLFSFLCIPQALLGPASRDLARGPEATFSGLCTLPISRSGGEIFKQ